MKKKLKNGLKTILSKIMYIFSRHLGIQRFGVFFVIGAAALSASLVGGYLNKLDIDRNILSNQALYTGSFTSSLTQTTGEVDGVYSNQANNMVYVLFHVNDLSNLALNASNYSVLLEGRDEHGIHAQLNCNPATLFYVYGNTGYMGVFLVNGESFSPQLTDIIIRNDKIMTTLSREVSGDVLGYKKYDQFRIRINPGAGGIYYSEYLDTISSLDTDEEIQNVAAEIYRKAKIDPLKTEMFQTLNDYLTTMEYHKLRLAEYAERCENDGLIIPDDPKQMSGDDIYEDDNNIRYMKTNYIYPDGMNLRWFTYDNLLLKCMEEEGYTGKREMYLSSRLSTEAVQMPAMQWSFTDGTDVENMSSTKAGMVQQDIANYEDEISSYLSAKHAYQKGQVTLLQYDSMAMDAAENITYANNNTYVVQ